MYKNEKIVKLKEKLLEVADIKPVMEYKTWGVYELKPLIDDPAIITHSWFAEEVTTFAN